MFEKSSSWQPKPKPSSKGVEFFFVPCVFFPFSYPGEYFKEFFPEIVTYFQPPRQRDYHKFSVSPRDDIKLRNNHQPRYSEGGYLCSTHWVIRNEILFRVGFYRHAGNLILPPSSLSYTCFRIKSSIFTYQRKIPAIKFKYFERAPCTQIHDNYRIYFDVCIEI